MGTIVEIICALDTKDRYYVKKGLHQYRYQDGKHLISLDQLPTEEDVL